MLLLYKCFTVHRLLLFFFADKCFLRCFWSHLLFTLSKVKQHQLTSKCYFNKDRSFGRIERDLLR